MRRNGKTAAPDVIVSGHSHEHLSQPVRIGNTLIVSSGSGGKYLGSLTLSMSDVISVTITRREG
jgi:2',3'-cyclic-nucleotide 2'-phosphodiesterase (5'-nucleotidase family)